MLFQPSNIYPSTFSGIGAGTVDVTQGLNVSWQVNGDTPMTAYQVRIYQNDSASTLMYDSGSVTVSPAFEPHDKYGNATYFTAIISAAALSTAGIVNGYQYGYKMLITQWWGVSDYVEQTSASVFITRSTPNISIDAIPNPVAASSTTITATYSQAQGDPISTVEWVFALAGSESNPIRKTGAISTQVLSFDADGLITGNTYSIMCNVVTSTGMEASTGYVQFPVLYSSSSLGINYQLAQLKNSSAVYLSWDDLGSNILAYPYTDTTKTTNGITFTVNGEGDVVASGTASADAYFAIADGTSSQLGMTAGKKFVITSGYSGSKIVITETNGSNVVVSTIEGSDPLQYIATSTTNTLKISIVIPSGSVLSPGQQLKPMIALEDKIVAYNNVSVNIEPIQDLHGYANPWPAGGGVNKCSYNTDYTPTAGIDNNTINLFSLTLAAGTYTFSCKQSVNVATSTRNTLVVKVGSNAAQYENSGTNYNPANLRHTITFTVSEESTVVFSIWCHTPSTAATYNEWQVESGSFTAYSPYSNICPISGRTGLSVYRTGKNLYGGGLNQYNATNVTTDVFALSAGTYTFSVECGYVFNGVYVRNGNTVSAAALAIAYSAKTITFTLAEDYETIMIQLYKSGDGVSVSDVSNPQLELGSTDTTYEPYSGSTYTSDWTSVAGTVYGGSLDVVTRELTVNKMMFSANTSTMNNSEGFPGWKSSGVKANNPVNALQVNALTNVGKGCGINTNGNNDIIFLPKQYYNNMTQSEWIALAQDVQIVYELATPLTYQLTPTQVAALVTNNVWANSGDVTVSYTTDTGTQATLTGPIVSFSNTNAQNIPTPQFIPGITGLSIYRYLQGELALQHVYDLATGATSILDYFAPSQTKVSYLLVAHSNAGDLFLQTTEFTPTFWFYSILLCDTDSNGNYHVSREYIFKYGVETGAVSNNNDPTIQKNFTPYPNRQPISALYKTGKLSGYIGKTNNLNQYSDSISLQNAIYDISVSTLDKFLKSRKGDVIKVDTASSIQMQTEDTTTQQALKATIDWVEVGDSSDVSIVSVPQDGFWPLA